MKTPKEIKSWFRNPAVFTPFGAVKKRETLAYIEQLEEKLEADQARIEELETNTNLMKLQMEGDCGCCKHRDDEEELCAQCMGKYNKPYWEYEGLPELPKKGES